MGYKGIFLKYSFTKTLQRFKIYMVFEVNIKRYNVRVKS